MGEADGPEDPRQGDYLPEVRRIYLLQEGGVPEVIDTPLGVLLLTQCCDLAREGKGHAHVASVVELSADEASNARSGNTPRYIELDRDHGENLFGDLGALSGVTHAAVVAHRRLRGVPESDRHLVGARVARRFSRFAYPDAVMPLLAWLVRKVISRARSETSPLGMVLKRVESMRIELDGEWESSPPWSITLLLIVSDGELPTVFDEPVVPRDGRLPGNLSAIAEEISKLDPGTPSLSLLWDAFCDVMAADAIAGSRLDDGVVSDFRVEVVEESELTFARYRRTTALDVDHISGFSMDGLE